MAYIFCFGDSNTYGYDARSMFGERLPEEERWPAVLKELSGWNVINEGMNGRRIPRDIWSLENFDRQLIGCGPIDLVIVMLGTNDLLNSFPPDMKKIGTDMEQFVRHMLKHPSINGKGEKILLIAPPHTDIGRFDEENAWYDKESGKFGDCYQKIAEKYGIRYADSGQWGIALAHDGVHISPQGHQTFGKNLWEILKFAL